MEVLSLRGMLKYPMMAAIAKIGKIFGSKVMNVMRQDLNKKPAIIPTKSMAPIKPFISFMDNNPWLLSMR